jgi:outer membrane protein OmpA-like peptidoglycan-associated protein
MRYFIIFHFLINILTSYSLSLSRSSYIDIPTANLNEGFFINLNGNYPIKEEGEVKFDPNAGFEFSFKRFNAVFKWYNEADFAMDLSYQIIKEIDNLPSISIGINDITYKKYISPVGSDSVTYDDENYVPRPPEVASAYLVASKKLNENIELTAGFGRGRFIGYGPRSKNLNFDIFLDEKHENVVLGLFGGLKFTILDGLSLIVEGDGRDANIGMMYETDIFKGSFGLTKVEQFTANEDLPLTPRIDFNLSIKFPTFEREAKGILDLFVYDKESEESLLGRLIISNGEEKMLAIPSSGKLSYEIEPGSYMLIFNSPNYEEKRLKVSIAPNETKKIYVDMSRKRKITIVKKKELSITELKGAIEGINIKFPFNKFNLSPYSYSVLDSIAEILKDNKNIGIMIIGHSDSVGTYGHNQLLSEERALAVKIYLADKGIAPERLLPTGYGETRPIADNGTEEGRAENRRVEFTVFSYKEEE